LEAVRASDAVVTVVWLDTPAEVAAARRAARAATVGREQSPPWVKGRMSKVLNLVGREPVVERIDGSAPLGVQADTLTALLGVSPAGVRTA